MRFLIGGLSFILATLLSFSAIAQEKEFIAEFTEEANATVVAINADTREITFKVNEYETVTLIANENVRNFSQIKVGDILHLNYTQVLTITKAPQAQATARITGVAEAVRAPDGSKPAGAAADQLIIIAQITALNPATQEVTIKGPEGNTVVVNVKDPAIFNNLKVGEFLRAVYTETLEASITTP